ncbi:hypothetical protein QYE77_08955 [Thermanaerothrix sp. 4228-RoL]|uniref:Uncharacterized protein n=1 Tax=Thermanaerothrix solaris TaxID=3058434 RepID=A0ABU3NNG3_9CHLR|nr:hypothetical protein [Thermanaerothrix sp. 4228-RoL]MDT8898394.1 hypothetical protein [Thermanaerothrix sp. 4228-RoL]
MWLPWSRLWGAGWVAAEGVKPGGARVRSGGWGVATGFRQGVCFPAPIRGLARSDDRRESADGAVQTPLPGCGLVAVGPGWGCARPGRAGSIV